MFNSWKNNPGAQAVYTSEFLHSLLDYPGFLPPVFPAIFHKGRPVAFTAGFCRTVRFGDREKHLLLMTFFTVSPEWKQRGLGRAVWQQCLHQARAAGYDGALHYCVEGNPSNHATTSAAVLAGYHVQQAATVNYRMRLLSAPDVSVEDGTPATPDAFLEAAAVVDSAVRRVWTQREAHWECCERAGVISSMYSQAGRTGVLTGYIVRMADVAQTGCLLIEDVLWGTLLPNERSSLLASFLKSASRKAQVATLPLLGYADTAPFDAARFRRSPRILNAYLTGWESPIENTSGWFYIDVL